MYCPKGPKKKIKSLEDLENLKRISKKIQEDLDHVVLEEEEHLGLMEEWADDEEEKKDEI